MTSICYTCKEPITGNYVRIGRKAEWIFHKDHFVCSNDSCKKNLKGGKVQLKDDKFYCPECYNDLFVQTCAACGEKITNAMIKAFGKFFHRDHFVCFTCKIAFAELNGKYYEGADKNPYCEEHNPNFPECTLSTCDKRVSPQETVKAGGLVFHRGCLTCTFCKKPVGEVDGVFSKDDKYYCGTHYYELFVPRCTSCGEFINSNSLSANEENYHEKCLKCGICDAQLDRYISVMGILRCDDHLETIVDPCQCSVCDKPIDDEVIPTLGKKVHPTCFNCQFCGKKLEKATAKIKDGKLSCFECLGKEAGIKPESKPKTKDPKPTKKVIKPITKPKKKDPPPKDDSTTISDMQKEIERLKALVTNKTPTDNDSKDSGESEDELKSPRVRRITKTTNWTRGDLIGKGGFGKVFQCFETDTGYLMAVKQVLVDEETAQEIENEINMMQNLNHKNIVGYFGTQRDGDTLNIFMEYVAGGSIFATYTRFGAFKETVMQRYTKQLMEALAYCHGRGVVHRDIKGRNILVNVEGFLKLADFGSAKKFDNGNMAAAPSMSFHYTPVWTAPEVLQCGTYGTKIDIWSAGCVIIEMGSAAMPWSEVQFENPFRALYHIGNSTTGPKVPESLSDTGKDFAALCLTRDPKDRPSATKLMEHAWLKESQRTSDDLTGTTRTRTTISSSKKTSSKKKSSKKKTSTKKTPTKKTSTKKTSTKKKTSKG